MPFPVQPWQQFPSMDYLFILFNRLQTCHQTRPRIPKCLVCDTYGRWLSHDHGAGEPPVTKMRRAGLTVQGNSVKNGSRRNLEICLGLGRIETGRPNADGVPGGVQV